MEVKNLIDQRNRKLWESLNKSYKIIVQEGDKEHYGVFTIRNEAIITIPRKATSLGAFTHELLHIFLKTKEVYIGGALALSLNDEPILNKIVSAPLIEHMGNCLEHIKMLPEFLRMGFDEAEFIHDYSTNKLTDSELKTLKRHFRTKFLWSETYSADAIDMYIGKYFAVIACPNTMFNYDQRLLSLKKLDQGLFKILEKFRCDWIEYDYNSDDILINSYHSAVFDFKDSLVEWTANKNIK